MLLYLEQKFGLMFKVVVAGSSFVRPGEIEGWVFRSEFDGEIYFHIEMINGMVSRACGACTFVISKSSEKHAFPLSPANSRFLARSE